jgi:hypothetical protein
MAKRRARLSDNDPLSSTDKVLAGFEQFNSSRQPVNPSTSQHVEKSVTRKATFQLDETVVKQLDRFHLQLQLDLGKSDAPYKEVIVSEAIARLLKEADENRDELLEALRQRQQKRKLF